jgi:hypothetical protein
MRKHNVPAYPLTQGPNYHWFGYYDKLQFDPSQRFVLCNEAEFEGRSPNPEDRIRVGMIDRQEGNAWEPLGTSRAWCWQQGCMLQWRPGSDRHALWNDFQDQRYVCHIEDVRSGERRTLPCPVYALSPDGTCAVTPDFRRIQDMRPGYGYAPLHDPNAEVLAPEDSGIWNLDMDSGEARLIISIAQVAAIPWREDLSGAKHYFNHLLFSPGGDRFVFLHRWRQSPDAPFRTRMLTAAGDGSDIRVIDDGGRTSHFIWRDANHVLAWSLHPEMGWGFYLFPDGPGRPEPVGRGVMDCDGHCTYLPGNEWIVSDTYPRDNNERQLYLYHVPTGEKVEIGRFDAGDHVDGELRCDLHPRHSPDGRMLTIDSVHAGNGRQLYLLDIGDVVE